MGSQLSCPRASEESVGHGGHIHIWRTTCIASASLGSTRRSSYTFLPWKKPIPKAAGFDVPFGPIEDNKLYDKDADDVIKHAEQKQNTEQEQLMMSANDPLSFA